jgi:hypothetical protein
LDQQQLDGSFTIEAALEQLNRPLAFRLNLKTFWKKSHDMLKTCQQSQLEATSIWYGSIAAGGRTTAL